MKFTCQVLASLAPFTAAFPTAVFERAAQNPEALAASVNLLRGRQAGADAATALFEPVPIFNAKKQSINVGPGSGHEWRAPRPDDLRGPCPGLNAFANHGFIPRNGYATIGQFIDATQRVVGMGPILAAFLAVLGAALDGDATAWSIGGNPSVLQGGLIGAQGRGLSGSHNKYEGDASPTRPDLYEPGSGNNYKTVAAQFQELIDASPDGIVTLDTLTTFRSQRFDTQIEKNPYFFNGPFTGVLVQPAAYTFIYRFMANHSADDPDGRLSYDTLKDWFGILGESGNYTAQQGYERIPLNWYRRPLEYPYEVTYFLADTLNAIGLYPKFASIGGNTGTVDSFTGVDIGNLTGGIFNAETFLKDNNLACFVFQLATQAKPDILLGVLGPLTTALRRITTPLNCPQLEGIDEQLLLQFPGYQKSKAAAIV